MLLRLWTVSGLVCYLVVPNAVRGNVLLAAWGTLFVTLNAYRLVELASERVPVWLDEDEWACYEASGLNRFVAPSCFKRLCQKGTFVDEPAGRVLKEENDPFTVRKIAEDRTSVLHSMSTSSFLDDIEYNPKTFFNEVGFVDPCISNKEARAIFGAIDEDL